LVDSDVNDLNID